MTPPGPDSSPGTIHCKNFALQEVVGRGLLTIGDLACGPVDDLCRLSHHVIDSQL